MGFFSNAMESLRIAARHPFGLDFEVQKNKIYIPVGSALNCLGYNDYLERTIGIARVALGIFAGISAKNTQERVIAGGHIFRGMMEMIGSFEGLLLFIDAVFTVYNVGNRFFNQENKHADIRASLT